MLSLNTAYVTSTAFSWRFEYASTQRFHRRRKRRWFSLIIKRTILLMLLHQNLTDIEAILGIFEEFSTGKWFTNGSPQAVVASFERHQKDRLRSQRLRNKCDLNITARKARHILNKSSYSVYRSRNKTPALTDAHKNERKKERKKERKWKRKRKKKQRRGNWDEKNWPRNNWWRRYFQKRSTSI